MIYVLINSMGGIFTMYTYIKPISLYTLNIIQFLSIITKAVKKKVYQVILTFPKLRTTIYNI